MQVVVEKTFKGETTFKGVKIDTLTSNKSCLCTVRYACSVTFGSEDTRSKMIFINLRTLHEILKKVPNNVVVRLFQRYNSSDLFIEYQDTTGLHHYFINTQLEGEAPTTLKDISSEYTLQVGVSLFRSFIKKSMVLKSTQIVLSILQNTKCVPPEDYIDLTFMGQDAGARRLFSTQGLETNPRLLQDSLAFTKIYSKQFDNTLLGLCLKSMEKDKKVTLNVAPGTPLILAYELGIDNSFIRYVLAEIKA